MSNFASRVYTLGPEGTNCANAARWWLSSRTESSERYFAPDICLFETLESALKVLLERRDGVLLSCAAYPELHTLVFKNLNVMELRESFVIDTHNMVLASVRCDGIVEKVAVHPAPQSLVPDGCVKIFANSNADAALICREGRADACITTSVAAEGLGLKVLKDFGPVPMAFLVHKLRD